MRDGNGLFETDPVQKKRSQARPAAVNKRFKAFDPHQVLLLMNEVRTWRTDRTAHSAIYELREIRQDARTWLSFLAEIGYPLSNVEQAIADDEPYQEGEPDPVDTDDQADEDTEAEDAP